MKLLIITNNPDRASFRQRIGVYLDILQANGIDCEVVRLPSGPLGRWKLFRRAREFDGVFLHKKGLNPLDAFWLRKYSSKIIYNFDDAVMYSDKRPERYSRSHFVPFRRSVELADMVVAGSSYLAEHARRFNSSVEILPIGLKVGDYAVPRPTRADDRVRLVWIGSRSTLSYLEEIRPAIEQIGSRFDNVILRIIGDDFLELDNVPVEKRLWSIDTRGIELATSDIGLAPLPDNRFTRGKCSFKILEYSAAGLPVIASPVGTNSEYVKEGATGFLAANARQWVDRMTQLIESPQLREQMGQEGRAWAKKFDVSVIGARLCKLIAGCLQNPLT
ncbi:MAG TPA: glycosyltransferase family 4 protein [Sedimentisphaerales bacterium]|nr:glycosyltransferase family 4 protein [Sedimentisphaerales bacterium]